MICRRAPSITSLLICFKWKEMQDLCEEVLMIKAFHELKQCLSSIEILTIPDVRQCDCLY